MWNLQSKIWDINLGQKEEALEKKAKKMWFNYVNFSRVKIQLEALNIIPELVARELSIICFFAVQKKIRIAVVDENDRRVKDYISKLKWEGKNVNINLCSAEGMEIALTQYDKIRKIKVDDTKLEVEEDHKVKRDLKEDVTSNWESWAHEILNDIYKKSIEYRASDIHIEISEDKSLIRFRIDWLMQKYKEIDIEIYKKIVKVIKGNADLILNINSKAQEWQYYFEINDRKIDLRVSILPTPFWESIVLRILDSSKGDIDIEKLGFLPLQLEIINKVLERQNWIILTSWPTWSWKTSTLYSFLARLNTSDKKIITLEDPIEYHLDWLVQSQITEEFDFTQGLISSLRQDPDVIMLWEIREKQSARTAMQAAITWHLVLSTIHTNSALESIFRLKDLWVENYLIATSLSLIIWQRLIRKNCPHCKTKRPIKREHLEYIKSLKLNIWIDISKITEEYFSSGCDKCLNTGFLWREVIWEFLIVDKVIEDLIFKEASVNEFKQYMDEKWFVSLEAAAIIQAIKWIINFDEAYKVVISGE